LIFCLQGAHPKLSAFSSADLPLLPSMDIDPSDRRLDRLLACLGLLDDAPPVFRPGERIPGAGVLLAIPALVASGAIDCAREVYGSIGPAFHGLRTTIVALLLMALLRIRRPEELKEHPPEDLGRILGLDRGPEVKTLRRKLARLAAAGRAARFGRALAQRRVAARGSTMGFLYVDGHVRVYHEKETLPKAHVARMRLSMPATTDYWVNDAEGEPLFVVTAEANAGLVRMLASILEEVRGLVGEGASRWSSIAAAGARRSSRNSSPQASTF
jgi:prepilin-type processing-associated H-X9-DG protein